MVSLAIRILFVSSNNPYFRSYGCPYHFELLHFNITIANIQSFPPGCILSDITSFLPPDYVSGFRLPRRYALQRRGARAKGRRIPFDPPPSQELGIRDSDRRRV